MFLIKMCCNHTDSQYRNAFSNAILQLQEKGELETLKQKWWKGSGLCAVRGKNSYNN